MNPRTLVAALALVVAVPGVGESAVLRVDREDPRAHPDLETAVAAASDGDVIRVAPGVWPTSVETSTSFTLECEGPPGSCELDGRGVARMLMITDGAEVTVRGFRFRDGHHAGAGGALFVGRGAVVTVEDAQFVDNHCDYDGGAAHVRNPGSRLRLERVLFRDNHAVHNAGAVNAVKGGRLEILASGFVDNTSDVVAGAVAVNNGVLEVSQSVFRRNEAEHVGAIHVVESWSSITNCTFDMNAGDVATVLANEGATATVERNIFSDEVRGVGFEIRRAAQVVHGCNVFWSNALGPIAGDDLGADSVQADPRFCDPTGEDPDLTLWALSPAAPVFSACGEAIGAYPVTCELPTDSPSAAAYWDPLRPRRR